jgi:hypothetical protein
VARNGRKGERKNREIVVLYTFPPSSSEEVSAWVIINCQKREDDKKERGSGRTFPTNGSECECDSERNLAGCLSASRVDRGLWTLGAGKIVLLAVGLGSIGIQQIRM